MTLKKIEKLKEVEKLVGTETFERLQKKHAKAVARSHKNLKADLRRLRDALEGILPPENVDGSAHFDGHVLRLDIDPQDGDLGRLLEIIEKGKSK